MKRVAGDASAQARIAGIKMAAPRRGARVTWRKMRDHCHLCRDPLPLHCFQMMRRNRRSAPVVTAHSDVHRSNSMDLTHVNAFTAAMQRKDLEAMLTHMADDIVLKTPLAAEPFNGKAAIRPVVEALLG